ncbi:unnamed protein product [Knipowitschia caucasica]
MSMIVLCADLPPPPVPPPAGPQSPTHPCKTPEGRGVLSPKEKRGGSYRPRDPPSGPRDPCSEHRGSAERREGGVKGSKTRQHTGSEDILPYSRPQFPSVNGPQPSSSSSMSSRGSGGRRRGEGPTRRNQADTTGAFTPGEEEERETLES